MDNFQSDSAVGSYEFIMTSYLIHSANCDWGDRNLENGHLPIRPSDPRAFSAFVRPIDLMIPVYGTMKLAIYGFWAWQTHT